MRKKVNKDFLVAFGNHLRNVRLSKDISQDTLMLKSGLSKNQVGLIERGEINTTIDTTQKLAEALDVSIEDLFKFEFKAKKTK